MRRRDAEVAVGTFTGVVSRLLEAWLAGAEGVRPVGDAVGLVSVPTQCPVTPAVIQLGVCKGAHENTGPHSQHYVCVRQVEILP